MQTYTDGCLYVEARNQASANKKIAAIYAKIRRQCDRDQRATAKWVTANHHRFPTA